MEELRKINAQKYRHHIIQSEVLPRLGKLICLDPVKKSAFRISSFIKRKKYSEKSIFLGIETYRQEDGSIISLENIDESTNMTNRLIRNLDCYRDLRKKQSIELSKVILDDGIREINKKIYTQYLYYFIKDKIQFNEDLYADIFVNIWRENLQKEYFDIFHQNILSASFNPKEPHDIDGISIFKIQKMIFNYINLVSFMDTTMKYSWISYNLDLSEILSNLKNEIIKNINDTGLKLQATGLSKNKISDQVQDQVFCSYCFDVVLIDNIVPIENSSDDIKICRKCHLNFFNQDLDQHISDSSEDINSEDSD